jgi:hypothetical protein
LSRRYWWNAAKNEIAENLKAFQKWWSKCLTGDAGSVWKLIGCADGRVIILRNLPQVTQYF